MDAQHAINLDPKKYTVIGGKIFNIKKLKAARVARREMREKLGLKQNSFPNRAARRASAKQAGYLPHGWMRYKSPFNVQTVNNKQEQEVDE